MRSLEGQANIKLILFLYNIQACSKNAIHGGTVPILQPAYSLKNSNEIYYSIVAP